MSDDPSIWSALGIAPTRDAGAIRRAYASRLRVTRPEDNAHAFQLLRSAYEAALGSSRQAAERVPARGVGTAESAARDRAAPESAPHHRQPPADEVRGEDNFRARPVPALRDESVRELRSAYTKLQRLLADEAPILDAALLDAADALTDAIHRADIELAVACETALAHMLLAAQAHGDVIIPRLAARLGWPARASDWNSNPIFSSVVHRTGAIEFLARLRRQPTTMAKALRFLREPHAPWKLRLALATDATLEQTMAQLLHYIHTACPDALALLDHAALAWWNAHFERSRARPSHWDWLWLVATLILPPIASLAPVSPAVDVFILTAVALTVLWAIWNRKPARAGRDESRFLRPALSLAINVPIGLWWMLALAGSDMPTNGRVACAIAGTLLSHSLATRRLIEWWVLRLDNAKRRWAQALMALTAFVVLAAGVGTDQVAVLTSLGAIVTAVVLVHRLPASQLVPAETRVRVYVTLATWMALAALLAISRLDDYATLRTGTVLFAAGVLITLAVCLAGEIRDADALRLRNRESS